MMRFAFVLLLLLPSLALGQFDDRPMTRLQPAWNTSTTLTQDKPQEIDLAVVRVTTPENFGGSGVILSIEDERNAVVLTNRHIIDREDGRPGVWNRVYVSGTINGQSSKIPFTTIYSDVDTDFAVLHSTVCKTGSSSYPLASTVPPIGTQLQVIGWGHGKQEARSGPRIDSGHADLSVGTFARSGDSGGAILWDGGIVGLCFGFPHVQSTRQYGGQGPASSRVALSQMQQVLTALGQQHNFTPKIKGDTTLTQCRYYDPRTGTWGTSPGVQLQPIEGPRGPTGLTGPTGPTGPIGLTGPDGKSAYELAVDNGFQGTVTEWLESLNGTDGNDGDTPTVDIDAIIAKVLAKIKVEFNVDQLTDEDIAAIVARLPPIYFRHRDGRTNQIISGPVPIYLNEGFEFVDLGNMSVSMEPIKQ